MQMPAGAAPISRAGADRTGRSRRTQGRPRRDGRRPPRGTVDDDRTESAAPRTRVRHAAAQRRGQGRLVVADHGVRGVRPRPAATPGRRASRRGMKAGSRGGLVSSGAIAAGIAPLGLPRPTRSGHPAGGGQRRPGGPGERLGARRSAARAHRRPGAAHRARHLDARRSTTERPAHARPAARARHASRSSTRTTPSPPTRSGSATTTGWLALVAHLVGADALVLLSDVDGLYDGDPRKAPNARRFIPEVAAPDDLDGVVAGRGEPARHRRDGLEAVVGPVGRRAGVPVLLAAATDAADALAEASVGTVFAPRVSGCRHAGSGCAMPRSPREC